MLSNKVQQCFTDYKLITVMLGLDFFLILTPFWQLKRLKEQLQ